MSAALLSLGCSGDIGAGTSEGTGSGSSSPLGSGGTVAGPGAGGSSSAGGAPVSGTGSGGESEVVCNPNEPLTVAAPIRRLTRFEYNKTLEAILDDGSSPGNSLPPEVSGNGFGNDANEQPVSSFLAEQYGIIAEKSALAAVDDSALMGRLAPCYVNVDPSSEESCARTFIENFGAKAYRRPLEPSEVDELVELQQTIQSLSDYRVSLASVIEAVLQSPDFLYRVEFGDAATEVGGRIRPTGPEMATRLSYFFWGAPPDEELQQAAASGALSSDDGVMAQARRLLGDPRARDVIQFFFSRFLPIEGLSDVSRDKEQYPTFSPQIGSLMRQETQRFLEYAIFEGPGDWKSALTAPYTFVNQSLAEFYGMQGVVGDDFRKVDIDTTQRKGLLTQASVLTGTTVSNFTNPVRRGVFLLRNVMCIHLPEPPASLAESIVPPEPTSGKTGRERYSAHSDSATCAKCHATMDPPGFALENYDAVGLWRDQENGVTIDASGQITSLPAPFSGPLELIDLIAENEQTHQCFAHKWLEYASGRTLSEEDQCLIEKLTDQFSAANFDVQELLVRITQTDAFLYMPSRELL